MNPSNVRFALGFLALPAFAAIGDPVAKLITCATFFICASVAGTHPRIAPAIIVVAVVTAASLLAPSGRVLFRLLGIPITETALLSGIDRGLFVEGLVFLSKASIDPGLSLPGPFGELLSESFRILAAFQAKKRSFDPKRPIESIDNILVELYASETPSLTEGKGAARLSFAAFAPALAAWTAFVAERAGLFGA